MLRFVEKPNLPQGRVRAVIVGEAWKTRISFEKFGITPIFIRNHPYLDAPVCSHADMQVVHLYKENFLSNPNLFCKGNELYRKDLKNLSDKNCKVPELVRKISWQIGKTELVPEYPKCAAYNVLLLDYLAVFCQKCIDFVLYESLLGLGYTPVLVRQGFARCSVCVVSASAVITADRGIARALTAHGVEVLEICPGGIALPGYDTGFLGGASFLISSHHLAFTGRLDNHPDAERILAFLARHQVEPVYLTDEPIFDIGTAVPVLEECS
ncbi:MAG: hypothetical protein E7458_08180 [Ruminococcaceae bacterium]|nr:hypothetical protein [Oscillospiraceae bacterium]